MWTKNVWSPIINSGLGNREKSDFNLINRILIIYCHIWLQFRLNLHWKEQQKHILEWFKMKGKKHKTLILCSDKMLEIVKRKIMEHNEIHGETYVAKTDYST